jgi:type I restriction-modification system DNA methylase subunit
MVAVCNDHGMIGVVMPHGVLFRGGSEAKIRQALLEEDLFEAVIGMPEKLFFGTGIPASVLILNKRKSPERQGKVLFIDASPEGFYHEGKNRNYLRLEDILRITAAFDAWNEAGVHEEPVHVAIDKLAAQWTAAVEMHEKRQLRSVEDQPQEVLARIQKEADKDRAEIDEAKRHVHHWLDGKGSDGDALPPMQRTPLEKFAAIAMLKEIAEENDFNLNISRYVDSTEPPPQLDVKAELRKLRELEAKRNEAEERMNRLLEEVGYVV